MINEISSTREGREANTIEYGNHSHNAAATLACGLCGAENDAFMEIVASRGAHYVEGKMHRLESYRAYNQKWPFDARKMVLSAEVVFEDTNGEVYVDGLNNVSTQQRIEDEEATAELMADLNEDERFVIQKTVEGYKPREIALLNGDENSSRTRQDKYSALRKLGAPIQRNMQRFK